MNCSKCKGSKRLISGNTVLATLQDCPDCKGTGLSTDYYKFYLRSGDEWIKKKVAHHKEVVYITYNSNYEILRIEIELAPIEELIDDNQYGRTFF